MAGLGIFELLIIGGMAIAFLLIVIAVLRTVFGSRQPPRD